MRTAALRQSRLLRFHRSQTWFEASSSSSPHASGGARSTADHSTDVQRVLSALADIRASNAHNPSKALVFKSTPAMPPSVAEVGYAASDRIIHNNALDTNPWQASCIEVRECREGMYCSNVDIDFSALRSGAGERERTHNFEVVHYFETSAVEGLVGYQYVATRTLDGRLPGSCSNHSAEGGYGVWVVPFDEYVAFVGGGGG